MRLGCGMILEEARLYRAIESIDGLFIPARNQMPIEIDGHLNGRVTHLLLHVNQAFALLQ